MTNTDWVDLMIGDGSFDQYDLSLGSEKSQFFVSGQYRTQEGNCLGEQFDRFNFRSNLTFSSKDFVNFGIRYNMRAAINFERGNEADARADLNVTRTRARLEPLTGGITFADLDAEWIKELGFEGTRIRFLQALRREVGPGDRPDTDPIPYDDPSLVFALPEVETIRNPLIE